MTSITLLYRNLYLKKKKSSHICSDTGNLFGPEIFRIKVYNALDKKKKKLKTTGINRDENFQKNSRVQPPGPQTE